MQNCSNCSIVHAKLVYNSRAKFRRKIQGNPVRDPSLSLFIRLNNVSCMQLKLLLNPEKMVDMDSL